MKIHHILGGKENQRFLWPTKPAFPQQKGGQSNQTQFSRNNDKVLLKIVRSRQSRKTIVSTDIVRGSIDEHGVAQAGIFILFFTQNSSLHFNDQGDLISDNCSMPLVSVAEHSRVCLTRGVGLDSSGF
jgi:hypothetical protein